MERDLKFYKKVAKELRERMNSHMEGTAVKVVVSDGGVDIYPAKTNETGTFFHAEELVDYCRFWKLSEWISSDDGVVRVHVY